MTFTINDQDQINLNSLAGLVQKLNSKGHTPATSGNYSLRSLSDSQVAFVSESGIDKSLFTGNDFIPLSIFKKTKLENYENRKSSDETEIHLAILEETTANCVLHSHMLESIWFADLHHGKKFAEISGLELLKGFAGVTTHETSIQIPILKNTQDILQLAKEIKPMLATDLNCYGIILAGHGLYVWGNSVATAKRHLEVFEYIFKYYLGKR